MACGPRWMSADDDRVGVRGFREFMCSADQRSVIGDAVAFASRSLGHWADSALSPVVRSAACAHRLFHADAWIAPISQATPGQEFRAVRDVKPCWRSFAHGFQDHPLRALPIPFAVENALPGPQIETTSSHGDDHL